MYNFEYNINFNYITLYNNIKLNLIYIYSDICLKFIFFQSNYIYIIYKIINNI